VGLLLVGLQFTLLGGLSVAAFLAISELGLSTLSGLTAIGPAVLLVLSAWVGGLALAANRPGNFRIVPTPKVGGCLITHGIYKTTRHPMYTSVLLLGASLAWVASLTKLAGGVWGGFAWLAWAALFVVLLVKAEAEEKALTKLYPGYAAYRAQTSRFIAWIF